MIEFTGTEGLKLTATFIPIFTSDPTLRAPGLANMPTVRLMAQGATLADAPLIQASIDPCYACTDR